MPAMEHADRKLVIGIVGGIGAGKSEVASHFAAHGYGLVDADALGHALLDTAPVKEAVVETWGPEVLGPAGQVDRQRLGRIVFADPAAMAALNRIMHPRIAGEMQKLADELIGDSRGVVVDAAVLFEAGWNALCDCVVFVDTTFEERLARVEAGRGWDGDELRRRESHQIPLDKKQPLCDYILGNHASASRLESDVRELIDRIEQTHDNHQASS